LEALRGIETSGVGPYGRRVPKKYAEVRQILFAAGWSVVRQRGSHEVWAHPDLPARIVVAGKPSDTVPVGTLASIRRASGVEHLR
jgi:predicted RNA binding protein YcfA (HicA-like mRNA interferase family)